MTVTDTITDHIVTTSFTDLPEPVVSVTRDEVVLDGCANMLAGSQEPLSAITTEYVTEQFGAGPATIVGHPNQTDTVTAAYANSVFCHSMDYELMWYPPTHPTSPTLPALLAIAETRDLPGQDVLCALAVGFEVQGRIRVAEANTKTSGSSFHPPGRVGPFGAAAGTANLLDLTHEQTQMALGIAGSRVSGLSANTGTMTKATHPGNAARLGLESALLAERGYTGNPDIFDAKKGFNHILYDNELDVSLIVENFGSPYRMVDPGLTLKKHPAQYPTHWSIDAALQVRDEHDLDPTEIESVEVIVGENCESANRSRPETGLAGKFSIHYTVAAALLDGAITIDTFRDDRRFASDMETMLERITITKRSEINHMDFANAWSRVTVTTTDGATVSTTVERPLGIWDNPAPRERYREKFYECAERAVSTETAEEIITRIDEFDSITDISAFMTLLQGK